MLEDGMFAWLAIVLSASAQSCTCRATPLPSARQERRGAPVTIIADRHAISVRQIIDARQFGGRSVVDDHRARAGERGGGEWSMFSHILVPTDGSPLSTVALDKSLELASDAGAKVTVLTAVEPFHLLSTDPDQVRSTRFEYERHAREQAAGILADAQRKAKRLGVNCEVVQREQGAPYQAIVDTAEQRGCDLIAMASHGRRGMAALVLGSETMKVLTHSKVPVLVYR